MTRPKLTHYKRPLLFFQLGNDTLSGQGIRLRIITPNGRSMWAPCSRFCDELFIRPCYAKEYQHSKSKTDTCGSAKFAKFPSARAAVTAMRKYDKEQGYERADFLGYL